MYIYNGTFSFTNYIMLGTCELHNKRLCSFIPSFLHLEAGSPCVVLAVLEFIM